MYEYALIVLGVVGVAGCIWAGTVRFADEVRK